MPSQTCNVCKLKSRFVHRRKLAISFHSFPIDPRISHEWKEFCGAETGVICSEHFSDNCFIGGREEWSKGGKRRKLIAWAVPTIRFPVKSNGTSILPENSPEENNSSSLGEIIKPEISESVDCKKATDMSADEIILARCAEISQLKAQLQEYKTKLEDTNKKLHEKEAAIFERDCVIEDLQRTLNDVTRNPNSETLHAEFVDEIKIEANEFHSL